MPERSLFSLPMIIILVLMFIVIVITLIFIMTPQIKEGWVSLLVDYVLKGLWPFK